MKTTLVFLLILVNISLTQSQDLIKIFGTGNGQSDLKNDLKAPMYKGPSSLAFDNNGNLYICDSLNNRVIKLNNNSEYEREFKGAYAAGTRHLIINDKNEMLSYDTNSFSLDSSEGKPQMYIDMNKSQYKTKVDHTLPIIYKYNTVFAYLKDGSIISVQNPGPDYKENMKNIMDKNKTLNFIREQKAIEKSQSTNNNTMSGINASIIAAAGDMTDDDLIPMNMKSFYLHHKEKRRRTEEYNQKNGILKSSNSANTPLKPELAKYTEEYILKNFNSLVYLGKDKNANTYWYGKFVYVFNGEGVISEAVRIPYDTEKPGRTNPAIHPSGDIYWLEYDGKKNYLYRVKRSW